MSAEAGVLSEESMGLILATSTVSKHERTALYNTIKSRHHILLLLSPTFDLEATGAPVDSCGGMP